MSVAEGAVLQALRLPDLAGYASRQPPPHA